MSTTVHFWGLNADTSDRHLGTLTLDGGTITASCPAVQSVLDRPLIVGNRSLAATDDPAAFLAALPASYRSPYFGASEPEDDAPTPAQKSMPPTTTPPSPPSSEPTSLRPDDSLANGTPTDTALSHYAAVTDALSTDPDHDALLSQTLSATDDAISSISAEMDAFEDDHTSLFNDTHGDTVLSRCADAHTAFIANCRNVVKTVASALTDYADTLAAAIQSHQSTGNFDPQPLADAHANFKKTRLASKLDLRGHVRDADKTFAADATALDGEQLEIATNAATFLSNDPENDESELYNQELANSGNPYRVLRDPSGTYSVIRSDAAAAEATPATQKAITPGVESWIDHTISTYRRRIPPAIMSAGGLTNPPPDLAAALNNLTTTTASLPAQLAAAIAKRNKNIEIVTNPDGTHKGYKLTTES